MLTAADLERYVDAFNRGDDAGYGAFYAPDVRFRNGGGTELAGRDAILAHYRKVRERLDRVMRVRAVCSGEGALAAALASTFEARIDHVALAGETLMRGDRLELESMALYEIEEDRFVRVEATTIAHRLVRRSATA